MNQDTITAISTPSGIGAVGIVRISGSLAKEVLKRLWISSQCDVDKFITHRFYYGKISTIDNVLAVWMGAPNSYTGEDVVEIHCHGGALTTSEVLRSVLGAGARLSEPGEFTRRAFLNQKMDLAQAESVADIINASSERALRLANEQLDGRLSNEVKKFMSELKEVKAFVESTIDFPEEDIEFIEHEKLGEKIKATASRLSKLALTYNEGRLIREGVKVVIVGKPNVGKSSILNALLGNERAIVHHLPGTTRDVLEEYACFGGISFRLIDTAGIRDSECEIEQIGIERARMKITEADAAIVVMDAGRAMDEEDEKIIKETEGVQRIIVYNKVDISKGGRKAPLGPRPFTGNGGILNISAKTGQGIDELKDRLIKFASPSGNFESEGIIITNLRHKRSIDSAVSSLELALSSINASDSAEFIAYHLQNAMDSLGSITGVVTSEDVLNEIFSRFCIGK